MFDIIKINKFVQDNIQGYVNSNYITDEDILRFYQNDNIKYKDLLKFLCQKWNFNLDKKDKDIYKRSFELFYKFPKQYIFLNEEILSFLTTQFSLKLGNSFENFYENYIEFLFILYGLLNKYFVFFKKKDLAQFDLLVALDFIFFVKNNNKEDKKQNNLVFNDKLQEEIYNSLIKNKNVILQGVPGVGKTYIARELTKFFDDSVFVQFHSSYSYDDFIIGFKPDNLGNIKLKKGIFLEFCQKAEKKQNKRFLFIIDEINRVDILSVFGELFSILDKNYRNEQNAITLPYDKNLKLYVPNNLYIIGTMNIADRRVYKLDLALKRRFYFFTLKPRFDDYLVSYLTKTVKDKDFIYFLINTFNKLNDFIIKNFGENFIIGHTYFLDLKFPDYYRQYNEIIKNVIVPILSEFFDVKDLRKWEKILIFDKK